MLQARRLSNIFGGMNLEQLGAYIQDRLNKNGISQAELARRVNVTKDVINKLCTGRRKPKDDTLKAIATELDIIIPNTPAYFAPDDLEAK